MSQKPSIPRGTRDFLPQTVARRNFIFSTLRSVFERYGFQPIETPSFENSSTLLGKYGDEGDRLIFRILNSGEAVKSADIQALNDSHYARFANSVSDKALRYDLTVPFARFVAQNQNELAFPFKRYQIQPVWRADRPAKGRYREFYQCDCDAIGSDSLLYEIELVQIFDEGLCNLGFTDFTIKINNRKILSAIAEICGEKEKITDITVALDKLDKVGESGVVTELVDKGISQSAIEKIQKLFRLQGDNSSKLNQLKDILKTSDEGLKGIEELLFVLEEVDRIGLKKAKLVFDLSLARGLNYYTGAIFEVSANNIEMGSICGGGRYADLTSLFGLPGMSGVGISFGADRIYDVMQSLEMFPESAEISTRFLFLNFGENEIRQSMLLAKTLRDHGMACEIYPSASKLNKQMKYANDRKIPTVVMIGADELAKNSITWKNMESGEQFSGSLADLIKTYESSSH